MILDTGTVAQLMLLCVVMYAHMQATTPFATWKSQSPFPLCDVLIRRIDSISHKPIVVLLSLGGLATLLQYRERESNMDMQASPTKKEGARDKGSEKEERDGEEAKSLQFGPQEGREQGGDDAGMLVVLEQFQTSLNRAGGSGGRCDLFMCVST